MGDSGHWHDLFGWLWLQPLRELVGGSPEGCQAESRGAIESLLVLLGPLLLLDQVLERRVTGDLGVVEVDRTLYPTGRDPVVCDHLETRMGQS